MAAQAVKLRLINKSDDMNNSEVIFLARNSATTAGEVAIAWRVIQNLGKGDFHAFDYPFGFEVGATDSFGNHSPLLEAAFGMAYEMIRDSSGDVFRQAGTPAQSPTEVEIRNNLPEGSITGGVYKDNLLYLRKTDIVPGEKAVFEFKPVLYVGVAAQVVQGQTVDGAVLSEANTELNLLGIASADIVWSGGGAGPDALPFAFTMENVVYA